MKTAKLAMHCRMARYVPSLHMQLPETARPWVTDSGLTFGLCDETRACKLLDVCTATELQSAISVDWS